jgi:monoamine oxidase
MNNGLTRRQALMLLGRLAGTSAAVFQAASLFGITSIPAQASPVTLKPLSNKKRSVVILGAGISGLTCAYELSRAGYDCTILEASHRAGGRNMTARGGDFIDELGNPQTCQFDTDDEDLYLNCGPARIPAHHTGLMHYCQELGVKLQYFCNHNKNCFTQDDKAFDGKPIRLREYEADIRGFTAELLAKSVKSGAHLDKPFSEEDFEKMVAYARAFGDLNKDFKYEGTERAGLLSGGILAEGKLKTPRNFTDLLRSNFAAGALHFAELADQSPAMLTPVGGMDHVVKGFLKHVNDLIQLKSQIQKVWLQDDGVEVTYLQKGERKSIKADYCINCIPTHIMTGIENNFPDDYRDVLKQIKRGKLFKIGFQAKERFWEKQGIFGGISWVNNDITQLWYPEHGFYKPKGVILGAYAWMPQAADRFAVMTNEQRLNTALDQGEKVHPGYRGYMENGISICWHRMNHMMGCGSRWSEGLRETGFKLLQAPAGHHYMVGDQISFHSGWQEGAIRSAWHALQDIGSRESAAAMTAGEVA